MSFYALEVISHAPATVREEHDSVEVDCMRNAFENIPDRIRQLRLRIILRLRHALMKSASL
jgi:hypothetical protein